MRTDTPHFGMRTIIPPDAISTPSEYSIPENHILIQFILTSKRIVLLFFPVVADDFCDHFEPSYMFLIDPQFML